MAAGGGGRWLGAVCFGLPAVAGAGGRAPTRRPATLTLVDGRLPPAPLGYAPRVTRPDEEAFTALCIGTSGWQYKDWRGPVYPPELPQRLWLEHYAEHFRTVEVNNAFYRLPERGTFARWRDRTPPGFVVAVKMSRYLTHVKRLHDPAEPVRRFLSRAEALGDRLGPVLIQLPPSLRSNVDELDATLACFP